MFRRYARTLVDKTPEQVDAEPQMDDMDPLYASALDPVNTDTLGHEDGRQDEQQDAPQDLTSMVSNVIDRLDRFDKRLNDKDREITRLRASNQTYEGMVRATNHPADGTPPVDPNPVLDTETAQAITERYKDDAPGAMVAVAEHLETRRHNEQDQRDLVATQQEQIRAAERNVVRQVEQVIGELGEEANVIAGDFLDLYNQGAAGEAFANTWLGKEIIQDNSLAVSPSAVRRLVHLEVYNRRGRPVDQEPVVEVANPRVMRPAAPTRSVTHDRHAEPTNQLSVEDTIGEAIVNSSRGDDEATRNLLLGG